MENPRVLYGRDGSLPHHKCPVPISSDILLNTLIEFSELQKLDVITQSLRSHGASIDFKEYDDFDGGIWTWLITVFLSPQDWAKLNEQEEQSIVETSLTESANLLVASDFYRFIVRFAVRSLQSETRITNQGRAHSSNPAAIEHEGLFFRSQPEIWLFSALRETGLPVMPLPVVTSNKLHFRRIEPDFVVICRGITFVIEVDGDRWHQETPAKAQERLSHLEDEGVRVIRISADKCKSLDCAKETVQKIILPKIERMLESR